jgi:two-component system sensor histidine kinase TctE
MGQQMALEQIVEQSDKLSQTVTMLLNQAVVSHRLQTQSLHALDLVALTRQTCMEMAVPALRQGIHLALDAQSNTLMILGDAFSLQQMLMNLIDNAVRYSSETDAIGKEVNIRLSQHEASVLLSVIDYGKGIADAEKHKVFERFYRGNYQVSGSGVGLTMVKEIVERHRARVRVLDSEPHGATIEIAFPLLILKEES